VITVGRARRLVRISVCVAAAALVAAGLAACGSASSSASAQHTLTLYTSVTQNTVDATLAVFRADHPGTKVNVFRAPTGQLNARIATDQRTGGVRADVLWVSDPLTMHGYDAQGLLSHTLPPAAARIPADLRTPSFAGAGLLYMVLVYHAGLNPAPTSWADLTRPAYRHAVALPDPAFAGSAMGALGYFSQAKGYGAAFYRKLAANGAVTVNSPDDVVTGVAQGRYKVGMTLLDGALAAVKKGAPVKVAWPAPGAIVIYSPIGTVRSSADPSLARSYVNDVLSPAGQKAIAKSGKQPALPGIAARPKAVGAHIVAPAWPTLFSDKAALLREYQGIFGA
jgi:iron(III) transport system substrate-binding protein